MKKALLTDSVHPILIEGLSSKGYQVEYAPDITYDAVKKSIHLYEGLIINSKINCDKEFIDLGILLKFIGRLGSGREVVDIPYAESKGIRVCFSPEGNKNAVAEHALGMLLSLANQINRADRELRQKIWQRESRRGWELKGKTIGIIGFGQTGSQFAKKLSGMEVNVLAYDKYLNSGYAQDYNFVQEVLLDELIKKADIISLHLPLAKDTFHFAEKSFFDRCKQGVVIINTSRGYVVDTLSLLNALESGHIGGACLDVFENEKPATFTNEEETLYARLYALDQVVLTPHIAGWTQESKYWLSKILLDKLFQIQ